MDKLKKTFSFRKKKLSKDPESSKPHQWQEDEKKVREATCSFQVKYLGTIEVFESRGMPVCEEAIKSLKLNKSKHERAVLYVSGDALRVVEEISKGLIVDQTVEKVSFCAPDRHHQKGFAYICRDGATKRWMCHGFMAIKESGERLSHAVGCAFAICLEKKQKREKEAVDVQFSDDRTSFARMGSFRQTTLTEKMQDPQYAIIAEPICSPRRAIDAQVPQVVSTTKPSSSGASPGSSGSSVAAAAAAQFDHLPSVPRPHASVSMLDRHGSLRMFPRLVENSQSPFKRDLSLRIQELPSNAIRQNLLAGFNGFTDCIPEEQVTEADPDKLVADKTSQRTTASNNMTAQQFYNSLRPIPVASLEKSFSPLPTNPWATEAMSSKTNGNSSAAAWEPSDVSSVFTSEMTKQDPKNSMPMSSFPQQFSDPFDLTWAENSSMDAQIHISTNPFAQAAAASSKAFEVHM